MKDPGIVDQPTVVIVDDSFEDRQAYRAFLDTGYRVLEAGTGQAGLELVWRVKPDCILLDYRLPDLDGLAFLEALQHDPSFEQPAVVVLTGHADVPLAVAALQAGATDFTEKDLTTASSVPQAVANAIGKVRLVRELDRQRQWLEATFASVADGVVAVDAAGRATLCNRAFIDLTGWPLGEVIGQRIHDVLAFAGEPPSQDWRQTLNRMLSGEHRALTPRWLGWLTARSGCRRSVAFKMTPIRGRGSLDIGAVITLTDLSELDESRRALADSEQQLRLAVEASGMGCFDWDLVAGAITWNRRHEVLWGFKPGESNGGYEDFASRVHPADLPMVEAALARSRAERTQYCCEFRVVWPDGSEHWVVGRGEFAYREGGEPVRMRGTVVEVTQRKQADAALHASRELLAWIVDSAPSAVFAMDRKHRFTLTNQAHLSVCRLQRDELIGHTEQEAYPPATAERLWADNEQVMSTGQALQLEEELVLADGARIDVLTTKFPLRNAEGVVVGLGGVATDITERNEAEKAIRASEERLRLAVEGGQLGTWHWDVRSDQLIWSDSLLALFGLPRGTPMNYARFLATLHPDDREPTVRRVREALDVGGQYQTEYRVILPDGSVRWIFALAKVYRDLAGQPDRMEGVASDITTRKEAEVELARYRDRLEQLVDERTDELHAQTAALEASNQLLRTIIDAAPVRVFWKSRDLRYLGCNSLFAQDAGVVCPAEITGRDDYDMPWKDQAEQYRADDRTVMQSRCARLNLEEPQTTASGREVWIQTSKAPLLSAGGEVIGILGVYLDITERKRGEAALKASQATLQRAQSVGRVGSWRLEGESESFEISLEMARLFDLAEDRPATFTEWFARVHPDDQAAVERAWGEALRGAPYDMVYRIVVRGEIIWIRALAELEFDPNGTLLSGLGTVQDITALKRAELEIRGAAQRLQLATDAADIGVWMWRFADDRLELDDRLCGWYEVPDGLRENGLDYAFWRSRVHRDDVERIEASLLEAKRTGHDWAGEFRIVLPGERTRVFQSAAVIERQFDGLPVRMVGIERDVTVQRALEDSLREARSAAEAANRAKSAFLATMSHEIRTPLNAVLGLAQLLEQDSLTAEQRGMVQRIRTAGQSLLGLINDILDFSKIEAGRLQMDRQPFELDAVLSHVGGMLRNVARSKGLTLVIAAPPCFDACLVGDSLRLEQVLLNLAGNAVKFTEYGEVSVRVTAGEPSDGRVRLRFEIRDTGIGIASDQVASLFSPFTQADGSITRRFGGTGLGLAICKHLVELMGGTLGVDSVVGAGSTFWFELDFELAPAGALLEIATTVATPLGNGLRLNGVQCLVVDDSEMNRDVLERLLRREGAHVSVASDGREALESLRAANQSVDVVLMDLQMPVVDGFTAMSAIRGELGLHRLPLIAVSAGAGPEQRQDALNAGANDFLVKPVNLEAVVAAVLRWTQAATPILTAPDATPATAPGATVESAFPDIDGLDTRRAALLLDDDRPFFMRLLRSFAADFGSTAGLIQDDLAHERLDAAAARLHALRGTAANIGALGLIEAAQRLEDAIATGQRELAPVFETFRARSDALQAALTPWVRDSPEPDSGAVPLDPGRLEALRVALVKRDLAAVKLFHAQRPALAHALGPQAVGALAEAVRKLRFDEALAILGRD